MKNETTHSHEVLTISEGVFVCEHSQIASGQAVNVGNKVGKAQTLSEGLLSVAEAARRLGVPERTTRQWCESGKLPAIHKPYGNKTRYLISASILEVFKSQSRVSESHPRKKLEAVPHPNFVNAWASAMAKGLLNGKPYSQGVIKDYTYYIEQYFQRHGRISVEGLKAGLAKIPADSVAIRQHYYKAVRCFAKYLISEGALESGFIEGIKPMSPRYHKPPKRHSVNAEDIEGLLKVCETALDRTLVILLSNTGLRATELCGLKSADVNLKEGSLMVRCGKGGKSRKIGLNQAAMACMESHLKSVQGSKWLFVDTKGQQMHRHGLYQRLERIGKLAGVKVSPHSLRRAFVTINANAGRPLQMLQMACGHSNIKTTMGYCRTSEQEMITAMKEW